MSGLVIGLDEGIDLIANLAWRGKTRTSQGFGGENGKPHLHLIEPGGMGRGKMEMDVLVPRQPAVVFGLVDQNIEHNPGLVHSAPQPVPHTGDLEHDLVQMPFIAGAREPAPDPVSELLAKFARPLPHRFVTNDDAAGGQQFLNHTQPEREPEIQPDGVADDLAGEPIAGVAGASRCHHPTRLLTPARFRKRGAAKLTVPSAYRRCLIEAGLVTMRASGPRRRAAVASDRAHRMEDREYYIEAGGGGNRSRLAALFGCRNGGPRIYEDDDTEINRWNQIDHCRKAIKTTVFDDYLADIAVRGQNCPCQARALDLSTLAG